MISGFLSKSLKFIDFTSKLIVDLLCFKLKIQSFQIENGKILVLHPEGPLVFYYRFAHIYTDTYTPHPHIYIYLGFFALHYR